MAKQREKVEFRYYEIPEDEIVLALLGEEWIREYGKDIDFLHFHNHMEIGCCHWGKGEVALGQERLSFEGPSVMIVPPKLPHTTNSVPGTRAYWEWLYVDMEKLIAGFHREGPGFLKSFLKRIQKTGYLLAEKECPELFAYVKQIIKEAGEKKPYYKESLRGLLYSVAVEILRLSDDEERIMRTRTKAAMIGSALDYVARNFTQEIKIKSLAAACGMSESHFRRIFEEGMNMKPGDYINLVRVQNACELLKKTDKSMEEVAAAAGFASISAFNRNFRKILDVSPYQWKRSAENFEGKLMNYRISAQKGWE